MSKLEKLCAFGKEFSSDLGQFANDIYNAGPDEVIGAVKIGYNHIKGVSKLILGKHHIDYSALEAHTVVFVHGYMQGAGFSLSLRDRAKKEGKNNMIAFIYKNSLQDIRESAMKLEDFLCERVIKKSKAREFTLVGHSQGGLVCRYLVECRKHLPRYHPPIRRIITLGTPYNGTKLAKYGYMASRLFGNGDGSKQMLPGSEFLKELNSLPLSIPYVSIRTEFDEIVKPTKSPHLHGAVNIILGSGKYKNIRVGHAGLLEHREVYKIVMDAIEGKLD